MAALCAPPEAGREVGVEGRAQGAPPPSTREAIVLGMSSRPQAMLTRAHIWGCECHSPAQGLQA